MSFRLTQQHNYERDSLRKAHEAYLIHTAKTITTSYHVTSFYYLTVVYILYIRGFS